MKILKVVFQLALLLGLSLNMSACNSSKAATEALTQNERPQKDPFAALALTDAQKPKFKAIKDKYRKEQKSARDQAKGDRAAMKKIMDNIRERERGEVKALLTKKQFTQYLEIMKEMRARRGPKGGGQGPRGRGGK